MGRGSRAALFAAAATAVSLLVGPAPAAFATQAFQDQLVSDDPAAFTPHVLDGEVDAIAVVGDKVVLGGQFTRAQNASGGPELSRVNILAFNRTTGVIDTNFAPAVDGRVRTLAPAPDGQSVYVGGQFNNAGGSPGSKVTRLNINTGQKVAGFNSAAINALVYDLKLSGNRLFIGGQFTRVGNQDRSLLAELDPTTGALRATGAVDVRRRPRVWHQPCVQVRPEPGRDPAHGHRQLPYRQRAQPRADRDVRHDRSAHR